MNKRQSLYRVIRKVLYDVIQKGKKVTKKLHKFLYNLKCSKMLCNSFGYFFPFLNNVIKNLVHDKKGFVHRIIYRHCCKTFHSFLREGWLNTAWCPCPKALDPNHCRQPTLDCTTFVLMF